MLIRSAAVKETQAIHHQVRSGGPHVKLEVHSEFPKNIYLLFFPHESIQKELVVL